MNLPREFRSCTIAQRLADQAACSPNAPAILAPDQASLTYQGIHAKIAEIVSQLHAHAIGCNDPVAIVLPNGPAMALVFLGVSACATAAPLNPSYTSDEFEFYLTDLRPRALIMPVNMDSPVRAAAAGSRIPILEVRPAPNRIGGFCISDGENKIAARHGELARSGDIALALHTSGTTGRPRQVLLTQQNLTASALNVQSALALSQNDRCINIMPLFHIHGLVGALLGSLMAGGSVICTPGFDASKFFAWLEEFRPTWYTAVPAMHEAILAQAMEHAETIQRCPLRFIRSSSAALPPKTLTQLEEKFRAPVIESYGMTEGAHQICSNPLPPGERKKGSVGTAAGPEVSIMDDSGGLLPRGEVGEIVIRGPSVVAGYPDNPAANKAGFKQNWFRTGDQGYIDADGYLFINGRLKEIINRGGEKISPVEVEQVLLEHPAVLEAVAFGVRHETLGEDVAAAVVLRHNASVTESNLKVFLADRLAQFKIPQRIVFIASIPRGATLKVQRSGLAEKLRDKLKQDFVAPTVALENLLASIYAEVLNTDQVGRHDNFFALGGDSLRATQVISRLRSLLRVNLPIATVFRKASIVELAREINASYGPIDRALIDQIVKTRSSTDRAPIRPKIGVEK